MAAITDNAMAARDVRPESKTGMDAAAVIWRALALAVVAAAAVGIAALALSGVRWRESAGSLQWPAAQFRVAGGLATPRGNALSIQRPDANGAFVAALPTALLDARDYNAVEIDVEGLTERQPIAVFWRSRLTGDRTFTHPANETTPRGVRARVGSDPNWIGTISGLGIIVAGSPPAGTELISVRAVSASARSAAAEALKDWFRVEEWNNQSINVVFLGGQYHALPFTLYIGLSSLLAIVLWLIWQRKGEPRVLLLGAVVIALAGWATVDLRWLANFSRVEAQTFASLAGKSPRDKRLAATDGPLYRFILQARERIAERPGRVIFSSDDAWLRVRGGYHLLPFNTLAIAYHRNLFEPEHYRSGDWLCFYARSGVVFDPTTQMLHWDDRPALKAERVLAVDGGELYRVLR